MATYRLTPRAQLGLERIIEYVERDFGTQLAERVLDRLEAAFEALAATPGIGHVRGELSRDQHVRFWPVGPSLIAYRASAEGIEILFVERGERDWEELLARPD